MEARKVRFASTGRRVVAVNDDGSPMGVYPPLSEAELEHMGAEGKQVPRTGSAGVGLSRPEAPHYVEPGAEGDHTLDGDGWAGQAKPEAPTFPPGQRTIICPSCGGSGYDPTYADRHRREDRCSTCRGSGLLWVEWRTQPDGSLTFIQHRRP